MLPRPRTPLRALTYLAPSLPLELFELCCDAVSAAIGRKVELDVEERISGPMHTHTDSFAAGAVDLGFLCSPSYLYLRSQPTASVELVPAGLVFDDERGKGKPVYFSDVVVRQSHVADCFGDLEGCVWGYNDTCSLSGYFSARQKLNALGRVDAYFGREVDTGSHLRSVQAVLQRDIDAAAIDSNVLTRLFAEHPDLEDELRVVETWGPFPIQPLVVRSALAELASPIAQALLSMTADARHLRRLRALGVRGFAPVGAEDYEDERCEMRALGLIA